MNKDADSLGSTQERVEELMRKQAREVASEILTVSNFVTRSKEEKTSVLRFQNLLQKHLDETLVVLEKIERETVLYIVSG